jgi:hypothetical protein
MASNHDTHVILNFRDKDTSTLIRLDDGMAIGGREKCKVAFGEDPRAQQQRVFIDKEHAISFLRKVADADQRQFMVNAGHPEDAVYAARIELREGDKRVVAVGVQ